MSTPYPRSAQRRATIQYPSGLREVFTFDELDEDFDSGAEELKFRIRRDGMLSTDYDSLLDPDL